MQAEIWPQARHTTSHLPEHAECHRAKRLPPTKHIHGTKATTKANVPTILSFCITNTPQLNMANCHSPSDSLQRHHPPIRWRNSEVLRTSQGPRVFLLGTYTIVFCPCILLRACRASFLRLGSYSLAWQLRDYFTCCESQLCLAFRALCAFFPLCPLSLSFFFFLFFFSKNKPLALPLPFFTRLTSSPLDLEDQRG